jgi:hypothetical protein
MTTSFNSSSENCVKSVESPLFSELVPAAPTIAGKQKIAAQAMITAIRIDTVTDLVANLPCFRIISANPDKFSFESAAAYIPEKWPHCKLLPVEVQ